MLKMKNTVIEMKTAVVIFHGRLVITEEKVSGLANKPEEIAHNSAWKKIQKT